MLQASSSMREVQTEASRRPRVPGASSTFPLRRRDLRGDAVRDLNDLATELQLERVQVHLRRLISSEPKVDRLIRLLEPRCQTALLAGRLRDAVKLWKDHGGALSQPMTESPADPTVPENCNEADESEVPLLPRHRVLQPGYILKSKAFMLTFNSDTFTRDTSKTDR